MPGKRKGQFFVAGSLLLCVLFFAGLPAQIMVGSSYTGDLSRLSENLEREIPNALNLAMLGDGNPAKLGDFAGFVRERTADRYVDVETLWVVAVPDQDSPGEVKVYAGNWLGRPCQVSITLDSDNRMLSLNDEGTDSETFSGVPGEFDIRVSFEGRAWSSILARDKTSLYSYLRFSRGENSVAREITG